jgi:hypothetical protein
VRLIAYRRDVSFPLNRDILDEEWLTHWAPGTDAFRNHLNDGEDEMSLTAGRVAPEVAGLRVLGDRRYRRWKRGHQARYVRAGTLRAAGFRIVDTGNTDNPEHVSAYPPGQWDDGLASVFESCFVADAEEEDADG